MAYVSSQGMGIHYIVEGKGPPLVLQHGLCFSLEAWHQIGYVDALKHDYQLILIDARGHGASSRPHDPDAYRMALRAGDVVAVLDDLNTKRAHFLGYSMGGWIGWGLAKYAPERFHSLVMGGSSLYGNVPQGVSFVELCRAGMDAFLSAIKPMFGERYTPELEAMCLANDLEALVASMSVEEQIDFEALLPNVTVPCLLFGGEQDPYYAGAEECSRRMPNAVFVSLPGLDHIEAQYRTDLVLPHVREFLAQVG
jgi:pimeloyl-ACP methyl ester carboxylesterase